MNDAILAEILSGTENYAALLANIPTHALKRPNVCGIWDAQQLLAHIIGWQSQAVAIITALRDGLPIPETADDDTFNANAVAVREHHSWEVLRAELKETVTNLIALVRTLPSALWDHPLVVEWAIGSTLGHYPDHRAEFEALLV